MRAKEFILRSNAIFHTSSLIGPLSFPIDHPLSLVGHRSPLSSLIGHRSSRPSSFIPQPSSVIVHPSSAIAFIPRRSSLIVSSYIDRCAPLPPGCIGDYNCLTIILPYTFLCDAAIHAVLLIIISPIIRCLLSKFLDHRSPVLPLACYLPRRIAHSSVYSQR